MKVLIDTDLNFPSDDFEALLLALVQPEWEILGVGAAAGNTWAEEVEANLLQALAMAGRPDIPVARGADYMTFAGQRKWALGLRRSGLRSFVGAHEKGHRPRVEKSPHLPAEREAAADCIIRHARALTHDLELLCLGPLTNVAVALRREPELATRVKKLHAMGGCFSDGDPERVMIDFNFWFDPSAARLVMNSGMRIRLLPLNVCKTACCDEEFLQEVTAFSGGLAGCFASDFAGMARQHGVNMPLWDQLLVTLLMKPRAVSETRQGSVEVDTRHGPRRGYSTFLADPHGPVEVVSEVDRSMVLATILEGLRRLQGGGSQSAEISDWKLQM